MGGGGGRCHVAAPWYRSLYLTCHGYIMRTIVVFEDIPYIDQTACSHKKCGGKF